MSLIAGDKTINCLISTVLLLNCLPVAMSNEEETATKEGAKNDDSHHNPNSDADFA